MDPPRDTFKRVTAALLVTGKSWKQLRCLSAVDGEVARGGYSSESEQSPLLQRV